jgi:hypothetical protein
VQVAIRGDVRAAAGKTEPEGRPRANQHTSELSQAGPLCGRPAVL